MHRSSLRVPEDPNPHTEVKSSQVKLRSGPRETGGSAARSLGTASFFRVAKESDEEVLGRRLEELRRDIASTLERLNRLRDEEYGLALALARLTGVPSPSRPSKDVGRTPDASTGSRLTPLVRAVLRQSATPLTRVEVRERLQAGGRDVSLDAVSASLSYLRRHGMAANLSGSWIAVAQRND